MSVLHLIYSPFLLNSRHEKLLAELQFAFLSFLAGQVYTAFEQWKSLVNMICCADEYLLKNPALFKEFTGDLYFQVFLNKT